MGRRRKTVKEIDFGVSARTTKRRRISSLLETQLNDAYDEDTDDQAGRYSRRRRQPAKPWWIATEINLDEEKENWLTKPTAEYSVDGISREEDRVLNKLSILKKCKPHILRNKSTLRKTIVIDDDTESIDEFGLSPHTPSPTFSTGEKKRKTPFQQHRRKPASKLVKSITEIRNKVKGALNMLEDENEMDNGMDGMHRERAEGSHDSEECSISAQEGESNGGGQQKVDSHLFNAVGLPENDRSSLFIGCTFTKYDLGTQKSKVGDLSSRQKLQLQMFKGTLTKYDSRSGTWTVKYDNDTEDLLDWFDILDIFVNKSSMPESSRKEKVSTEVQTTYCHAVHAELPSIDQGEARANLIGEERFQRNRNEVEQVTTSRTCDIEPNLVPSSPEILEAQATPFNDMVHNLKGSHGKLDSPLKASDGEACTRTKAIDANSASTKLLDEPLTDKANYMKACNFVDEMCSLWSQDAVETPNETPSESKKQTVDADMDDLSTPEREEPSFGKNTEEDLQTPIRDSNPECIPKSLDKDFEKEDYQSPPTQEQTSSEQLMDLLATPLSAEVTPESKACTEVAENASEKEGGARIESEDEQIGNGNNKAHVLMIPRQILSDEKLDSESTLASIKSARKKLKLGCDKEYIESELCNLLINKKIIKHWREGLPWACKDVSGKALDAYRVAELEERLVSTAKEARIMMSTADIGSISKKAHQQWLQMKGFLADQESKSAVEIKSILKKPSVGQPATPQSVKRVTFLKEKFLNLQA